MNATASPTTRRTADPIQPEREREQASSARCERDHERGDARRRVARADVQEHVVADDDEEARGGHARSVGACEPGQPARAPEDEREPGCRDRVAQERDVARGDAVVEQLLDDGERARPEHDDDEQREVGLRVHQPVQRARARIVRWSTSRRARYFLDARDPRRVRRRLGRRDLHARPGHRADDSQHARRRAEERRRDRGRRRRRPGGLDRRGERGSRRAPDRVGAGLPRAEARRRRLPRVSRRAVALRGGPEGEASLAPTP